MLQNAEMDVAAVAIDEGHKYVPGLVQLSLCEFRTKSTYSIFFLPLISFFQSKHLFFKFLNKISDIL